MTLITFGPIPSRRLGRSLGINHIPRRVCSYDCVYCQLGAKDFKQTRRESFHSPSAIVEIVSERVRELESANEAIDYLTFVPNGEPTLDAGLGKAIVALRSLGKPIAVITNASMLWMADVRHALAQADWVSVNVDAVDPGIWQQINAPAPDLNLEEILDGVLEFASSYAGTLTSETMLVRGVNDGEAHCRSLALFLARVSPAIAYVATPTRAPREAWVEPPNEEALTRAFQVIAEHVPRAELLIGQEGNAFASSDDPAADILAITAVHPLREAVVREILSRTNTDWAVVQRLLDERLIRRTDYRGCVFFVRTPRFHGHAEEPTPEDRAPDR